MALILSIETSTQTCSVCLSKGEEVISIHSYSEHFSHTEIITTLIQKCMVESNLKYSDLDAIAISKGPGSYTALRVGTSTAKGLCYGLGIPLISIDSLEALAVASRVDGLNLKVLYVPAIDARRMEVFTSFWEGERTLVCKKEMHSLILEKDSFEEYQDFDKIVFSGDCSEKIKTMYDGDQFLFSEVKPCSKHLVTLAIEKYRDQSFEDVALFSPVYAKPPNITTPKKVL